MASYTSNQKSQHFIEQRDMPLSFQLLRKYRVCISLHGTDLAFSLLLFFQSLYEIDCSLFCFDFSFLFLLSIVLSSFISAAFLVY